MLKGCREVRRLDLVTRLDNTYSTAMSGRIDCFLDLELITPDSPLYASCRCFDDVLFMKIEVC